MNQRPRAYCRIVITKMVSLLYLENRNDEVWVFKSEGGISMSL